MKRCQNQSVIVVSKLTLQEVYLTRFSFGFSQVPRCNISFFLITMKLIFTSTFRTDWAIVALETCRTSHILNLTCFTIHYHTSCEWNDLKIYSLRYSSEYSYPHHSFWLQTQKLRFGQTRFFLRLFVSNSNQDSLTVDFRG